MTIKFKNSYANLPPKFYSKTEPTPVSNPKLILSNSSLAQELEIPENWMLSQQGIDTFSGNKILSGSEPLAMVYAGHQFGHFSPQLGDGRAILLGECLDTFGMRRDIQLKGSGQTNYSRSGDGRSPIGPVIREYLVSEAMHALNIPTTRALAAVSTGDTVYRDTSFPGGILTRVAKSHVRIGTFEYFASINDIESVQILSDYCINRLYPDCLKSTDKYLSFLKSVVEKQISLVAKWMSVGFIHGVMNTDNISISGETIDFGPCAFMEAFNPSQVFSAIDVNGRYRYSNQPEILLWNLMRLAETLLPLIDKNQEKAIEKVTVILKDFWPLFETNWLEILLKKIGFSTVEHNDDLFINELLALIESTQSDFTLSFRYLSHLLLKNPKPLPVQLPLFESESFKKWVPRWKKRLESEPSSLIDISSQMNATNPLYIPRNHLVEAAIQEAIQENKFDLMKTLNTLWKQPFLTNEKYEQFSYPATDKNEVTTTFCGT
ncbi:YdiU family protein [bacterium]|jgi:serine/tyrosine/threonine adenylyltransferase|nr:YdiU family protein [bacterium]